MFPILILWIHLIAAIAWIGGTLFLWLVLRPALKRLLSPSQGFDILNDVSGRFRTVRWISLVTLLVTGLVNLLYEGGSARLESDWGAGLMVKLLFVAIVMGLSGINDYILPSTGTASAASPRRLQDWLTSLILILGLFIVFIAVYLGQTA